jgi:magnesium chelatase family protein
MVSRVTTVAFSGVEALPVDVQVMIAPGKVGMSIVGLPDKAVAESRDRVQAALHSSGLAMPHKRVTVNLSPADLPKEGSHYDLPIALGLMAAMGAIPPDALADFIAMGELSLDGSITHVAGTLPAAMAANALSRGLICPKQAGSEAAWASEDMPILAPQSLIALANHFKGTQVLTRPTPMRPGNGKALADLADIKGQETAKRALEIAAAGGHNMLMVGPPGSGKSMLAARLPSILPPLEARELLEVSMINSVAGELREGKLSTDRPFRAPHHSASMAALVGGGLRAKPGEVSLAHHGVLFLDELPEFPPNVLDSLRQPLENGDSVIARANHRVSYPAQFQMVAAMNPCKCGHHGTPGHSCKRGDKCSTDYQGRLSGPLLDRIDIRVDVPAVSASDLIAANDAEPSSVVAARVAQARDLQTRRYGADQQIAASSVTRLRMTNASVSSKEIEKHLDLDEPAKTLLQRAADAMAFSARGYHRILKVARTIADLDASSAVSRIHLAEAISLRTSMIGQA